MMKKRLAGIVFALCVLAALSGCARSSPDLSDAEATEHDMTMTEEPVKVPVIENLTTSFPDLHVPLLPMEFEADEPVQNPYYRRTTDAEGTPVYQVSRADNGQMPLLPMNETIVYITDDGNCYYEAMEITYDVQGESTTMLQYQLYVPGDEPTNS